MNHQFRDTFPSDKPITRNHVVRALWRVAVEWSKGFFPFSGGQIAKLSRWGKHLECIGSRGGFAHGSQQPQYSKMGLMKFDQTISKLKFFPGKDRKVNYT